MKLIISCVCRRDQVAPLDWLGLIYPQENSRYTTERKSVCINLKIFFIIGYIKVSSSETDCIDEDLERICPSEVYFNVNFYFITSFELTD